MRLRDKVVLITGAGSGLGRESAVLFAEEGARVVVTDVSAGRADAAAALIADAGGEAVAVTMDVSDEAAVEAGVDAAVARYGRLDVLYANAAIAEPNLGATPFEELSLEDWNRVLAVNLTGVFLPAKHAVRVMKPQGQGTIVVTSSAGSLVAYPGWFAYGSAKGGVNSLVRHLAWRLGSYGIRINALCPTHGMSPNLLLPPDAPVVGRSYEEVAGRWDPVGSPIPFKAPRPPSLRDNANVALFLACDESMYMSGVCLPSCDGGTLARVAIEFETGWESHVTATVQTAGAAAR
jgi:NAD(P)-dependent dehydrogenase (short-subunit alcohol dehydrogenase family)